jgi:polyhydroxyalkanoate synthesis regulator protein
MFQVYWKKLLYLIIINQNNKIMQKVLIIYVPFKRKEAIKKALHACMQKDINEMKKEKERE